jgi:hypothetical protein
VTELSIRWPAGLDVLFTAIHAAGGRPFLVGGAVRDALLGLPVKDYDVEVFGLPAERLRDVLATLGSVNAVGEAFTVYKVSGLSDVPGAVDVSLPRRDSKVGIPGRARSSTRTAAAPTSRPAGCAPSIRPRSARIPCARCARCSSPRVSGSPSIRTPPGSARRCRSRSFPPNASTARSRSSS